MQVLVGDRPTWKSADHPFRHDPRLQLSGIPTLVHWTPDGPGERIGEMIISLSRGVELLLVYVVLQQDSRYTVQCRALPLIGQVRQG